MRALVTGAGGFLGRYLVEQLVARGDRVRGLARGSYPALADLDVECVRADIRDRDAVVAACRSMDVVFHTAAVAGIWGPWDHFYGINTLGTQHVIEGCRQHQVPCLVYSSSPSVTFDGRPQSGVDERAKYPDKWLCHYPHTKALAEQAVLAANGKSLRTCALRPHLIWGPRDRYLIPRLLQRARAGQLRQVGDGTNQIDTIYVSNAATAHLQAADAMAAGTLENNPVAGRAYFLSQGEPVNCWDWINQILTLAGLPPVRKSISFRAAWVAGSMLETTHKLLRIQKEPRMTRFLAAQLATDHYFDIRRAREDFGYSAEVGLENGMQRLGEELAASEVEGLKKV